ncbi:hypothetical protein ACFOWE_22605 [Planomonospora corallina]|uniref:Lipoprotein n=1 Tax=Planomonospora corallina TaxID=1806052 RepID=A0ABV8IA98_9ACTN
MRRIAVSLAAAGLVLSGCSGGEAVPGRPSAAPAPPSGLPSTVPSTAPSPAASPSGDGQESTGSSSSGRDEGLREAMAAVSGSGPADLYFEYGAPGHWRELGVLTARGAEEGPWASSVLYGMSDLSTAPLLAERTGIDPFAADRAITIGHQPDRSVRLDGGVDAGTVRRRLTERGAERAKIGGRDGLVLARDRAAGSVDRLRDIGVLNLLNKVVVTGSTIAMGTASGPLTAAFGGPDSLAGSPSHAAVADCLGGNLVNAVILREKESAAVALYAVGLRRPVFPEDTPVNVVCVLPRDGFAAEVKKTFTGRLTTTAKTLQGESYGKYAYAIEHDEVASGGFTALRATLRIAPGGRADLAHRMLADGNLEAAADPASPLPDIGGSFESTP